MIMKTFKFKYFKALHRDGREGLFLMGKDPDHFTPMTVINEFLGEKVLELNGSGIGVNLFLPEWKLDAWQKLALLDEAWGDDQNGSTCIHLNKLKV